MRPTPEAALTARRRQDLFFFFFFSAFAGRHGSEKRRGVGDSGDGGAASGAGVPRLDDGDVAVLEVADVDQPAWKAPTSLLGATSRCGQTGRPFL